MQTIRGTKDILPHEVQSWQNLYLQALQLLTLYNYHEIRTPIIENTKVFLKSMGDSTDIINKEMYRFTDQGQRDISLRPEGTASIARAIASNRLYNINPVQKLWYMGPMFRYERPQQGRQRQFHQLGIECLGSNSPLADVEVISIAHNLFHKLKYNRYTLEINSLGNKQERSNYQIAFTDFLQNYQEDLDTDSKRRLQTNPLRILDSKNSKTQEIIQDAPCLRAYLQQESIKHFEIVLSTLDDLKIPYQINTKLVRGLDYYNHTAFEVIHNQTRDSKTICGGGRYNNLVQQFGGPDMPGVGWAIGIERLLMVIDRQDKCLDSSRFEIITCGITAQRFSYQLSQLLTAHNIRFNLNFSNQNLNKQIKKAVQNKSLACIIIGENEVQNSVVTIKWLEEYCQETIPYSTIIEYLQNRLKSRTKI